MKNYCSGTGFRVRCPTEDADENWRSDEFWEVFFGACEIAAIDEEKRIT